MVAWNTNDGGIAVVAGARTPFAKAGGALRHEHVTDLAKRAMQESLYRADVPFEDVDEVLLGNVVMPVDATNPARVSALWAGIPYRVPALTVQRNCASGMEAVADASDRIRAGRGKMILAGGAESMSTLPLLFPDETVEPMTKVARAKNAWQRVGAVASFRPRHFKPVAALERGLTDPTCDMIMGKTAEILAHEFGISRKEQDEFALRSHQKATAAAKKLADEIVPEYAGKRFEPVTADTGPRANQTMEALAKLKPIFDRRDGTVTVGNSCQVTDGAVALLLADPNFARSEGMDVLGYVRGYSYVGLDPARMGLGPAFAIEQLLRQSGLSLKDVPLFEINEAFAAQVLASIRALASDKFARDQLGRDSAVGELDPDRLNVNGGAIALGHPVGATGARLVLTMLLEMRRRDVELGIAALCVGGGQGAAILLQRR
ncbi:MAG TPA: acetyl-CoA C-acyltransferase [Tepidisphaeraceae bacterium]|nr:acetyl-CoA C-acyltransferase [Tepidisphaeraceae bacterium]